MYNGNGNKDTTRKINSKLGFLGLLGFMGFVGILHIAKLIGRVCGAKRPHSVFEQPIYTMSM